ncbi:MAG: hypothetical protein J7549_13390, partial [Variovorax sp.]|nr:hypothetical protein [Variovorax sp.]
MTLSNKHAFAPGARALLASAYARPAGPAAAPQPSRPSKPMLSAWQRWEMDTLDEPEPAPAAARGAPPAEV